MKQPLAIVGASTRSAAASAVRAGFQPLAADLFADADLRAIATTTRISPYPDGFLDWLRAIEPPAWMYTGALENHPALVDQMAWIAPLWGNPGDVLARVRSPWELSEALTSAGLLFPEIRETFDGLPLDGSWLVKSYQGASGSGVRIFDGQENSTTRDHVYQRRVAGVPCAAVFAALDNTSVLIGVTRQLIGEPWLRGHGFQYAGSIGVLPMTLSVNEAIEKIGVVLTQTFELSGLFGVDFILDGERVWPVEVNPRYTASVEICERATGMNAIALHVVDWPEVDINRLAPSGAASTNLHGKAILFAKQDIAISESFAEYALAEALREPWPTLADVSPAATVIEAGRPILTLFSEGRSEAEVERRLRERVTELEQLIYENEVRP